MTEAERADLLSRRLGLTGADALRDYGVGTYRRYGLQDAARLFGEYFAVAVEKGFDRYSGELGWVFLLAKAPGPDAGACSASNENPGSPQCVAPASPMTSKAASGAPASGPKPWTG